ncbi:hypothetical protein J6590_065112 [Homalodisca vitripennis]|nr:hypothetical protein J6590_065112 [Homalodisca vitripennis]
MLRPTGFWRLCEYFFAQMHVLPKGGNTNRPEKSTTDSEHQKQIPTIVTTSSSENTSESQIKGIEKRDLGLPLLTSKDQTTKAFSTTSYSPSELDPVVGWIYRLTKAQLITEMLKHDLDTEGRTTDYLRKSFVQFLRSQPDRRDEAVGGRESFGNDPVGPNTSEAETDKRSRELNLREILEVPPDTSDDEVKRLLVSLKTRSKAKSNWDTGHDYASYAPYDGATRSVYTDAFKLPALATSQYIAPGISHDSLRRHAAADTLRSHNEHPNRDQREHPRKSINNEENKVFERTNKLSGRPEMDTREGQKVVRRESIASQRNTTIPKNTSSFVCWNCEKPGHIFRNCRFPKTLKCYFCKTPGFKTTDCKCDLGNGVRAQAKGGHLEPRKRI